MYYWFDDANLSVPVNFYLFIHSVLIGVWIRLLFGVDGDRFTSHGEYGLRALYLC